MAEAAASEGTRRRKSRREEAEADTLRRGEGEEGAPEVRGLARRREGGDGRSGLKGAAFRDMLTAELRLCFCFEVAEQRSLALHNFPRLFLCDGQTRLYFLTEEFQNEAKLQRLNR
jgi:hypothetical protein